MSIVDHLRRWWEFNARFFRKVYNLADLIAGLAFLCVVFFGFLLFHRSLGITLPLSQRGLELSYVGFVGAIGVFGVSVIIQTLAGLRSFGHKVKIRVLDYIRE